LEPLSVRIVFNLAQGFSLGLFLCPFLARDFFQKSNFFRGRVITRLLLDNRHMKDNKKSQDYKQKGQARFGQWLKEGNIDVLKGYISSATIGAITLLNVDFSEEAKIQCNTHPDEPIEIMEWKVLFRLLGRNSKTLKCAKCQKDNLTKLTVESYENQLLENEIGLTLVRGNLKPGDKLNSKVKMEHRCALNPEHPSVATVLTPVKQE